MAEGRRWRVLHLTPNLGRGGAQRVVSDLLARIDRTAFEPHALSLFDGGAPELLEQLEQAGVPRHTLGKRPGAQPAMLWRVDRAIRTLRPDLIHTHRNVLYYTLLPFLRPKWWRPAAVHTVHSMPRREMGWLGRELQRVPLFRGATCVAIARPVQRELRELYGPGAYPLIPNGIDIDAYGEPRVPRGRWRRNEGIAETELLVANVASLTPQKDQALLIEAFCDAVGERSGATLAIAGEGPERPRLEQVISRRGAGHRVRLLGHRRDVVDLLHAADLFALSSAREGNPLSVMEAGAAGLPVVATVVGGVPDLIEQHVNGVLVPPGDREKLAKALAALVWNGVRRERLRRHARTMAAERFDVEKTTRAYEKLYQELLSGRRQRH
jgi:glycosyltransferase involved in cell wall biosynthesis